MGVSKPVVLPSIKFNKQGEADAFFKDVLERYEDDEYLDALDEEFVYELLQRHPDADSKIGSGVIGIYRGRSADHPSSCFHVHRNDGSKTDFSYKTCVRGASPSLKACFYQACQRSIANSVSDRKKRLFENAGGEIACRKTGALTTFTTSDYRHTTPRFREIVEGFIGLHIITLSEDLILRGADMQYSAVFSDSNMADDFLSYHLKVANLEIFKRYEIPSRS